MWRAAFVLLALTATAHADRAFSVVSNAGSAAVPCWRVDPAVYPAKASTNVARNTSIWIVGGLLGDYQLHTDHHTTRVHATVVGPNIQIVRVELPLLAANTTYSVTYGDDTVNPEIFIGEEPPHAAHDTTITTFTTGTAIDKTPENIRAFPPVTLTRIDGQTAIDGSLEPSDDTVAIAYTIRDRDRGNTLADVIVPRQGITNVYDYCLGLDLRLDEHVCFIARALDAAGNAGQPVEQCATVSPSSRPEVPRQRTRRPLPRIESHDDPIGTAIAIANGLVLGILASWLLGRRARRRYVPVMNGPAHGDAVALVARQLVHRSIAVALVNAAAIAAIVIATDLSHIQLALATSPFVAIAVVALAAAARGRRITRIASDPRFAPESDGERFVFIVRERRVCAWMRASPVDLFAASARTVPRAIARSRS